MEDAVALPSPNSKRNDELGLRPKPRLGLGYNFTIQFLLKKKEKEKGNIRILFLYYTIYYNVIIVKSRYF